MQNANLSYATLTNAFLPDNGIKGANFTAANWWNAENPHRDMKRPQPVAVTFDMGKNGEVRNRTAKYYCHESDEGSATSYSIGIFPCNLGDSTFNFDIELEKLFPRDQNIMKRQAAGYIGPEGTVVEEPSTGGTGGPIEADIFFDFGRPELSPDSLMVLHDVLSRIDKGSKVTIVGYCFEEEAVRSKDLAQRREEVIANFLNSNGIESARIATRDGILPAGSPVGKAASRRATVTANDGN